MGGKGRWQGELGVDRMHLPSTMNEAAKLPKVKVDLKLRGSPLCHEEGTGSAPSGRSSRALLTGRATRPVIEPASYWDLGQVREMEVKTLARATEVTKAGQPVEGGMKRLRELGYGGGWPHDNHQVV